MAIGRRRGWAVGCGLGVAILGAIVALGVRWLRPEERAVPVARALPSPATLEAHCREVVGAPRVLEPAPGVFVAIGYDLANSIAIQTNDGVVIVDAGMSPGAARRTREALFAHVQGPVRALVLTHSHIDHVGGAAAWIGEGTDVWATEAFVSHFFKQYGAFRKAETLRGRRQFAVSIPETALPCAALGARPDLDAALETGVRLPNRTFEGSVRFEVGATAIELHEARGETHDQLFVWLPDRRTLLPGDNYYRAFPNLYTIRGTSPRPVDDWIESLDRMRALAPEALVPSHTTPVQGADAVRAALVAYRDGIQWVRDAVVRAANGLTPLDTLVDDAGLPPHLAAVPALGELYGQVDWSARALFTNALGWFDGRAAALYPLDSDERARRLVSAMGGLDEVERAVREAQAAGDDRWALELLGLLRGARPTAGDPDAARALDLAEARSLRALAENVANTNGRGYLLQTAYALEHGAPPVGEPVLDAAFLDAIPLSLLFRQLAHRLVPERAVDVHESVVFSFPDGADGTDLAFVVTVRRGIAEIVSGAALPGTPAPLARVEADASTWRRLALGVVGPAEAVASGGLVVEGDLPAFVRFLGRFDRSL